MNNNDTLHGLVKIDKGAVFSTCDFKTGEWKDFQKYSPEDIKGYGFDGKVYSSGIVHNQFVETLITGALNLYAYKDQFYLSKNNIASKLKAGKKEVIVQGQKYMKEDLQWKIIVAEQISDCFTDGMQRVEHLLFRESAIMALVEDYNICVGNDFVIVKKRKPTIKPGVRVLAGYSKNSLLFEDYLSERQYLASSYEDYSPFFGIGLSLIMPRISDQFSIELEAQLSKSNYTSSIYQYGSITSLHHTNFNMSTLTMPLSMRYGLKRIPLYAQIGAYLDSHFKYTSLKETIEEHPEGDQYSSESDFINFDLNQTGFWCGVGTNFSIGPGALGIGLRYYRARNDNHVARLKAYTQRLSALITLSF